MAIPEHIKKQAAEAVSYKDITAKVWLTKNAEVKHSTHLFTPKPDVRHDMPITPEVGKHAKATVDSIQNPAQGDLFQSRDVRAMIRLVSVDGVSVPLGTPNYANHRAAQKILHMNKSGHDADAVHRAATKDEFARCG